MDDRDEVREFLSSRRARIALADVRVEYYAELERGDIANALPARRATARAGSHSGGGG